MDDPIFTEEALKAQDGRVVPLTDKPGGRVIGDATLHYDPEAKALDAEIRINDPKLAEFVSEQLRPLFSVKVQEKTDGT
jgi:hypothetical protein